MAVLLYESKSLIKHRHVKNQVRESESSFERVRNQGQVLPGRRRRDQRCHGGHVRTQQSPRQEHPGAGHLQHLHS